MLRILEILENALTDKVNRLVRIKEFQEIVWNTDEYDEVLSSLAHDLDYYEPDSEIRQEDPAFYGDERLEKEIIAAIQKLKGRAASNDKVTD